MTGNDMALNLSLSRSLSFVIGESTQTVKNIVNQGRMMEDELGKSKTVQSHIRRKEMMTRMSVYVGLFIFILTILYLIWKRIWIPGSSSSTSSKPLQNSIPHEQPEGVKMKLEDLDESCVFGFCL